MENLTINNFGELVRSSVQDVINYKNLLINCILTHRHKMGYNNTGDLFDKLSDMDVDQLELFEMQYNHLNEGK